TPPAQSPEIPLASRVQACCGVINLTVSACPELQGQLHKSPTPIFVSIRFRLIRQKDKRIYI
ncbi:hypothetical protein ACQUKG_06345, partial [Ralstonia pseudosolanacearum]